MAEDARRGTLEVVVVSPARPIYEGSARSVTAPAWNVVGRPSRRGYGLYGQRGGATGPERLAVGQIGILPGHAPLVAALGSGPLRVMDESGKVMRFAVRGGFLKVGDNKVTILVDQAVAEADVNASEAKAELDETRAALRHPRTDEEFAELLDRRTWSESQLKLAGT